LCQAQQGGYTKGQVIDSVPVAGTNTDSYALYLPKTFNPGVASPVVFIFDPAARGPLAAKVFRRVADIYGYILVASNNSRNGPYDANFTIADNLFNTVLSDFKIDPKRIYTAGFSGGARLALTIALRSGQIQGVIACGAGFSSSGITLDPTFSYAAIVGTKDFNYSELQKTDSWLKKLHFPHVVFEFEIEHQWPFPEQLEQAFRWLQLEAYRKGLALKYSSDIRQSYQDFYQAARQAGQANNLLLAERDYECLIRNFAGYYTMDSLQAQVTRIRNLKEYRIQKQSWEESLVTENDLIAKYTREFEDDLENGTPDSRKWEKYLTRLKAKYAQDTLYKQDMLHRVLSALSALAFEEASYRKDELSREQQIFCYDICILSNPGQLYSYLRQMENYLSKGDKDMAMHYLEALIQSGYRDFDYLKNNKTVLKLKGYPGFENIFKK